MDGEEQTSQQEGAGEPEVTPENPPVNDEDNNS